MQGAKEQQQQQQQQNSTVELSSRNHSNCARPEPGRSSCLESRDNLHRASGRLGFRHAAPANRNCILDVSTTFLSALSPPKDTSLVPQSDL
ncbi:hypothetical protein VTN77DRAFT_9509 [Rasamsonia byssochlamydoides]|uniref:uncharacterized protein n=1 Tax=Rasamsonia byssochlamydoides TaxID=89139 RepID=UPI0037428DCE